MNVDFYKYNFFILDLQRVLKIRHVLKSSQLTTSYEPFKTKPIAPPRKQKIQKDKVRVGAR